jgi:hypothetical protein
VYQNSRGWNKTMGFYKYGGKPSGFNDLSSEKLLSKNFLSWIVVKLFMG